MPFDPEHYLKATSSSTGSLPVMGESEEQREFREFQEFKKFKRMMEQQQQQQQKQLPQVVVAPPALPFTSLALWTMVEPLSSCNVAPRQ